MSSTSIERGDIVRIKPEWLNPGESGEMQYVVLKEYDEMRSLIQALGTGLPLALFTRTSMSALTDFALLVFLFIKTGNKSSFV